jgi:hypothetical protein
MSTHVQVPMNMLSTLAPVKREITIAKTNTNISTIMDVICLSRSSSKNKKMGTSNIETAMHRARSFAASVILLREK